MIATQQQLLLLLTMVMICFFDVFADGARVLSQPDRIYLTRSMAGRLECPVDANPPVTRVIWTKDGRPVQVQHVSRSSGRRQGPDDDPDSAVAASAAGARVVIDDDDGALMFETVTLEDAGRYSCTPYSILGNGQTSAPVQVLVKGRLVPCF